MTKPHLNNIIFCALTLILGGLMGYLLGNFQAAKASFPEITPIQEVNRAVATVKLMEVGHGNLIGKVEGQKVRMAYNSEQILELAPGDSFEIPLDDVSLNLFYLEHQIPEEARFIASNSGKYFYHILDKRSLSITPKNRVFFSTADQAEKAGYLPRD